MNMKSMIAGTGIACLISTLSANANSTSQPSQAFYHFGTPSEYQTSSPREYRPSEYRPTSKRYYSYEDEDTLRYGFGITGMYGFSSTDVHFITFSELSGIGINNSKMPDLAGANLDFHIEIPGEEISHEVSFNFGYMYGDKSISAGSKSLTYKIEHSSTALTLGYKTIYSTSEKLDIYFGAKLGVSLNRFREELSYSGPEGSLSLSSTSHLNTFTPSFLFGLKLKVSDKVAMNVGYELYFPTGKWKEKDSHLFPYHCVTLGVGVTF
jgi:opacity protein-like surface antigen